MTFDTTGVSDVHRGGDDPKEIKAAIKRIRKLPTNNHSGDRSTFLGDPDMKTVSHITQTIIAQVMDAKESYIKDCMIEYAQAYAKELGHEVQAFFLDKAIVDEIITLGTHAYLELHAKEADDEPDI